MQEAQQVTSIATLFPVRVITAVGVTLLLARGFYLPASFLIAVLLILTACRLWADHGLRGLSADREACRLRLFPGDEATFSVHVRNGKRLPVSLELFQSFPEGLDEITPALEGGFPGSLAGSSWADPARPFQLSTSGAFPGAVTTSPRARSSQRTPWGSFQGINHSVAPRRSSSTPRCWTWRTRTSPSAT